jgi:hypothetical protein
MAKKNVKKRGNNLKGLGGAEILCFSRDSPTALAYIFRVLYKGFKFLSRGFFLYHLA